MIAHRLILLNVMIMAGWCFLLATMDSCSIKQESDFSEQLQINNNPFDKVIGTVIYYLIY